VGWMTEVPFPTGARNFSLHSVQSGSGAHPDAYPVGTRGFSPEREADRPPPSSVIMELHRAPIRLNGMVLN
jgi:hypothetical protein